MIEKANCNNEKQVVSVWGKISRRELLQRLAIMGGALGVGQALGSLGPVLGQSSSSQGAAKVLAQTGTIGTPYNAVAGQTFRPFEIPKGTIGDLVKEQRTDKRDGTPRPRRRDSFWYSKPNNALGVNLFQYTQSATFPTNSCAQAACATLLHKHNILPAGLSGDAVTDRLYQTHPPEGGAGTTKGRLVTMMRDYGLKAWSGTGAESGFDDVRSGLRKWVAGGYPAIVLLDMRFPTNRPTQQYFGHYVVVFAYDEDETNGHVYVSNWDYKSWRNDWTTFKKAWSLPDYPAHSHSLILGWR